MKRIGVAASKMSKGSLWLYNFFVVLLSFLFSFLIFLISAGAILIGLIIMNSLLGDYLFLHFHEWWTASIPVCMMSLAIAMGVFNLLAISKNIKLRSKKRE